MSNKLDLIRKASQSAPHKRKVAVANTPKVIIEPKRIRDNQSFYVGDARAIVEQIRKGSLSNVIQKALLYADKNGVLDEFYKDE